MPKEVQRQRERLESLIRQQPVSPVEQPEPRPDPRPALTRPEQPRAIGGGGREPFTAFENFPSFPNSQEDEDPFFRQAAVPPS